MALLLRILKRLGFLFLIIILIYAVGRPTQIWLDGFYSGVREPYLQMMSSEAVTLRWQSEKAFSGVVRYGLKPEELYNIKRESIATEEHELRLTNLKPATKYFYSVGNETEESFKGKEYWFKTAPKTDKS
ncbi:MAG: fibronectin type III domain-containing protein, partial [Gammaproteobacteria bacterium]|nr:fibronectin type III domain-containing protein [Gammaproteobacteria bacterium]